MFNTAQLTAVTNRNVGDERTAIKIFLLQHISMELTVLSHGINIFSIRILLQAFYPSGSRCALRFAEQAAQLSLRMRTWEAQVQESSPAYGTKIEHLFSLIFCPSPGLLSPGVYIKDDSEQGLPSGLGCMQAGAGVSRHWTRDSQPIAAC